MSWPIDTSMTTHHLFYGLVLGAVLFEGSVVSTDQQLMATHVEGHRHVEKTGWGSSTEGRGEAEEGLKWVDSMAELNSRVGVEAAAAGERHKMRKVCVFCGSSTGRKKSYQDAAVELGTELVSRRLGLVYGGGSVGLMGLVSKAVHEGGGHVLGIIPRTLMRKELTGETVGEVNIVAGMHQRKAEMSRHSDAFVALPGGYGTLEELLEVISWAQLGIHRKPVGLLNVDGYYDSLLALIDSAVDEGFIEPSQRHLLVSATDAKELLQKLEEYVPVEDGVADRLQWETVQIGYNSSLQAKTAR